MANPGNYLQIIERVSNENGKSNYVVREDELKKFLDINEDHFDKNIMVVSIAGAFRKGKSFMLNCFLRYLHSKYDENWIGDEEDDLNLTGFPCRGGAELETEGILVWSRLIPRTLIFGEEVVIMLMDTQGAFDKKQADGDCAIIFALSTLLSSVQIFNIQRELNTADLKYLQTFTDYAQLARREASEEYLGKPFQHLCILIRDWPLSKTSEYELGEQGGASHLKDFLDEDNEESKQVKSLIYGCFDAVQCFLLPHPGLEVEKTIQFKGRVKDIENIFWEMLRIFVTFIFDEDNFVGKTISGSDVTFRLFPKLIRDYAEIVNSGDVPRLMSYPSALAEYCHKDALTEAIQLYTNNMDACKKSFDFDLGHFEKEHHKYRQEAMEKYLKMKKYGSMHYQESYREELEDEIDKIHVNNGDDMREKIMLAKMLHESVVLAAVGAYTRDMQKCLEACDLDYLKVQHQELRQIAIDHYCNNSKLGSQQFETTYREKLEGGIIAIYQQNCRDIRKSSKFKRKEFFKTVADYVKCSAKVAAVSAVCAVWVGGAGVAIGAAAVVTGPVAAAAAAAGSIGGAASSAYLGLPQKFKRTLDAFWKWFGIGKEA